MSPISIICFLICLFIILSCFRKGADILSPARVFGFVWSFVIGLNQLKLSTLQQEWSIQSWIILLIGIISFLVGAFISYICNLNTKLIPIDIMREKLKKQPINEGTLFKLIIVIFIFYSVSYGIIYFIKGTLPLFGVISYTKFSLFGLGLFLHNMVMILVLTIVYHIFVKEDNKRKVILEVISVVTIVSYLFLLQRGPFFIAGPMCVTLLYYTTRRIKFKTSAILFLSISLLFYLISTIRIGELISLYQYADWKMKFPQRYAFLTEPYIYLVMNLEYFARSVDRLDSFSYGYYSFDFLLALTGLKHWMSDYYNLISNPYAPSGWKDYTAFWIFYRDFGVIGIMLIPLLLGLGIGAFYYSMRSKPSVQKIIGYGMMVYVMMISFFYFPVSFLWFVYNVPALYLIFRFVRVQQKPWVLAVEPARL